MSHALSPLAWLYSTGVDLKNYGFSRGWKKVHELNRPVISVGNLTVGGTGKTPIISHLVSWALQNSKRPGIVSRGYGGKYHGIQKVKTQSEGAKYFGDEPYMLHTLHPEVPIYVCADRVKAGEKLIRNEGADFILADDAFQHRRLGRDLDILIVDLMEPIEHYLPLPQGRARESFEAAARADFVILNKVNLAEPGQLEAVRSELSRHTEAKEVRCTYVVEKAYHVKTGEACAVEDLKKVHLISGIGRPKSFRKLMDEFNVEVVDHWTYPDHHGFSLRDAQKIQSIDPGHKVLVTEKDAAKLKEFPQVLDRLWCAPLKLELSSEVEDLYAKVLHLLS